MVQKENTPTKQKKSRFPAGKKVGDGTPGPGRRKGQIDRRQRITADIADMVQQAMNLAGERIVLDLKAMEEVDPESLSATEKIIVEAPPGVAYLLKQAENNPTTFLTLVKQAMPSKIDATLTLNADTLVDKVNERRMQVAKMRDIIEGTATEIEDE